MCVLVALFIGLTVSAEEIIRDRKILKRESFLNLSRGSYLFSKIFILFSISAVQTLTFVLIGNYILEIKDMYFDYWLVLFTTSCCANILGLNISSAFNSAVTIYILIPFLLIPQILLSGVLVKFDKLNPNISRVSVVPVSGEMMVSRWAFEALAVNQFVNNGYEKPQYYYDKQKQNYGFKKDYWVPRMNTIADDILKINKTNSADSVNKELALLKNEITNEMQLTKDILFVDFGKLTMKNYDTSACKAIEDYTSRIKTHYIREWNRVDKAKDNWVENFENSYGKTKFISIKNDDYNDKLEELVTNRMNTDFIVEEDGRLISTQGTIFMDGSNDHFIRSHFFAPRKNVFGKYYSTYWVNILVIWSMSIILWLTLYYDILRKVLNLISSLRITKKSLMP